MFKLVIADEEGTKTTVPLVRDEITIGRKEGNTIRLTERNISRAHAQLRRSNGGFVLRDLGSYNGVRVNGQRVDGEVPVNAGDQIKLGDYSMAVESDQPVAVPPTAPAVAVATSVPPAPPPAALASDPPSAGRLVMLAGPTPGADYPLPASGSVRVGRSEELELAIEHRSVSREHAELRIGRDGARLVDLDSANGLRVNGVRSNDRALSAGDVIELGEVALRYVAPGESYVFDPLDALPYTKKGAGRQTVVLLGVAAVGLAVAAFFALGTGPEEQITTVTPLPPAPRVSSVPAPEPAPVVADAPSADELFAGALAACRGAVDGERFAEAIAHATSALKAVPNDPDATACMDVATTGHSAEQAYVRGKSALRAGDAAGAMAEFARLPSGSPFADKPEIDEARQAAEAQRRAAAPVAAVAAAAPVRSRSPAPRAQPAAPPEVAAPGQSPFQVASGCLARGDNACVIKALTGKARTPQELGLLIETHRSLGNTDKATASMEQYVRQFPTGPKASAYKRMLERQGQ